MTATKPKTLRVYLPDEETELLLEICEKKELKSSELLTKIVIAGMRAIKANDYRIELPLRFKIGDLEDPTPLRRVPDATAKGRK